MTNLYSLRIYQEIGYLISNKRVRPAEFIHHFSLSQYEFAQDLEKIEVLQSNYGLKIQADRDQITFSIVDAALFNDTYRSLCGFYEQYNFRGDFHDKMLLQFEICEMLLGTEGFIQIDTIAERLGYSRSIIRAPLKLAREFISSYNIQIENIPHHGIRLQAQELQRRRCLAAVYNWFKIGVLRQGEPWTECFSHENYIHLLRLIARTLQEAGADMQQLDRKKLRYYLIAANKRVQKGHCAKALGLPQEIQTFIHKEEALRKLAAILLKRVEQELNYGPFPPEETLALSVQLLCCGYRSECLADLIQQHYAKEAQALSEITFACLRSQFGLEYSQDPELMRCFQQELHVLIVRQHLGFLQEKGSRYSGRPSQIYDSPLICRIAQPLQRQFADYYQLKLPLAQLLPLLELLLYCLPLLSYTWPPLKIALISKGSNHSARLFKRLIEAKAKPEEYSRIDCYLYDETVNSPISFQDYDLVLSDAQYSEEEDPEIIYPYIDNIERLFSTHRDLCHDTLKAHQGRIEAETIRLETESERKRFLMQLRKRSGASSALLETAWDQATQHDSVLVMVVNTPKRKANVLQLGMIEPKYEIGIHKLDRYVVLIASITQDNFYFYNVLLRELVTDEIFLSSLMVNPDFKVINQQLNAILK